MPRTLWRLVLVLCKISLGTGPPLRNELTVDKAWSIHSERTVVSGPLPDRKAEHEVESTEYRVEDG